MKKWVLFLISPLLLLCTIIVLSLYDRAEDIPIAKEGELNLTKISITEDGPIPLAGEWYFSWKQWADPAAPNNVQEWKKINMPTVWNGLDWNGKLITSDGYATYYLRIILSEDEVGEMLGIYLPNAFTSYRVWLNGKELSGAGVPGTSREETVPAYVPHVVYFEPQKQEVDLIFHVANYHHSKGGLWRSIGLGDENTITSLREKQLAFEMFLIGSLMIMGFYHLGLYVLRRKENSTLFFGLFCLVIGLRAMMVGEVVINQIVPQFPWEWLKKIEYICFYMAVPLFLSFARQMYPNEFHVLITRTVWGIASVFSLLILLTPARIFTMTLTAYQVITVAVIIIIIISGIRAIKNKREFALLNLGVGVFYVLTIINDFLFYNQFIMTRELSPLGLFVFLFAQTFQLSTQFSRAFSKVEEVTQQLQELNSNLEKKVEERTAGLEKSQKETVEALIQMSVLEERNRIAHEIHDITGHSLTTVIVQLEAGKRLSKVNPDEAYEKMELSQELLRKGLQRMRESVRILGEAQETMNIEKAIASLIEETRQATGVFISTTIENLPNLNHVQKKVIFYALQEGLTNGIRHGKSTSFHFTLQTKGDSLQFELKDNGIGVEKVEFGFGLSAMRNRVSMLNGELILSAEKGIGCKMIIILPLDREFSTIREEKVNQRSESL